MTNVLAFRSRPKLGVTALPNGVVLQGYYGDDVPVTDTGVWGPEDERAFIKSCLVWGRPFNPAHSLCDEAVGVVAAATCRLWRQRIPIDLVSVWNDIKTRPNLGHLGFPLRLAQMVD